MIRLNLGVGEEIISNKKKSQDTEKTKEKNFKKIKEKCEFTKISEKDLTERLKRTARIKTVW